MRRYAFPFSCDFIIFYYAFFPTGSIRRSKRRTTALVSDCPPYFTSVYYHLKYPDTNKFYLHVIPHIWSCFSEIFRISTDGSFVVLAGFLCGYPMGAKVTSDLILAGRITKSEGSYLLSFCNNTSPMFIISYVIWQNLYDQTLLFPSLLILFASPILCSFVFRNIYKKNLPAKTAGKTSISSRIHFNFEIVDTCIMDGFETITKVGGYILLFSVLLSLLQMLPVKSALISNICLPILEITNGIPMLSKNILSQTEKICFYTCH